MAPVPSGANRIGTLSTQKTGAYYEQQARQFLEQQGLKFLAANVHLPGGEIDLIMEQKKVTVFVEVRYRRNNNFGDAAASVTRNKQKKLLLAAKYWLARSGKSFDTVDCRFDVLAFTGKEIEWLTNAFSTDV